MGPWTKIAFHDELVGLGVQPFNLALTLGGANVPMAVIVLERVRRLDQELLFLKESAWNEA